MKVILISESLEEPFEMDSEKHRGYGSFPYEVMEKVKAALETEQMRADHHKHGIFGR